MAPWFPAQPADAGFFDRAPERMRATFDVLRPASEVWRDLVADDTLHWCRIIRRIEWTSPRPFAVGTTRTAVLLGGLSSVREVFFRWEEGRRKSFHAVELTAPLFRRLAEDYLVEPTSEASCRFTWTIAFEPRPLGRPATPLNRRLLGTLFSDTARHYGVR